MFGIDIPIDVRGAKRAGAKLHQMEQSIPNLVDRGMKKGLQAIVDQHLSGMQNYARPRQRSRYVRTGTLGRSWRLVRSGRMRYAILSDAPYSRYVVGDGQGKGQAWMHRHRWWLGRRRIDKHVATLANELRKELESEWGSPR